MMAETTDSLRATVKALAETVDDQKAEASRLQAALSAAMRAICDPSLIRWGKNPTPDGMKQGYWVKAAEGVEFTGPQLHDAVNLLAADAGKDP